MILTDNVDGVIVWDVRGISGVAVAGSEEGRDLLREVRPNPAQGLVTIRCELARAARIRLTVVDGLGREVARIAEGEYERGYHLLSFDVSTLPGGVYWCMLETPWGRHAKMMQVAR